MSMKQEFVLLFLSFAFTDSVPTRITVSCDRNGFNCNTIINSKRLVLYQCPSTVTDVLALPWGLGEPTNTAWVTIRNCENVEIDMSCTGYRRPFEILTIENVTNLRFTRSITTMKNPAKLILKNIQNIPIIPENTFTIPHMVKYTGEAKHHELQEIDFENVHIGTIEAHAFHSLQGFKNFTWRNVKVDRLHANAIKIKFNTTQKFEGKFSMVNSTLDISEYLSFQLSVKEATFKSNKFTEIMSGGINGTIELFTFVDNIVNTLQPGSISILSKNVIIIDNTFNYLRAGSLSKISPGLLVDSHTSFGNLEFLYKFNNNNIIYVDSGSLNPDMEAYSKVATDFIFSFNSFLCTCENVGWLMSPIGHGYSSIVLQDFYETITDEKESNICSGLSCKKTISSMKHLLKNGQCRPNNITLEYFCRTTTTTSKIEPAALPVEDDSVDLDRIVWFNRTIKSGTGNILSSNSKLLLMMVNISIFSKFWKYLFAA